MIYPAIGVETPSPKTYEPVIGGKSEQAVLHKLNEQEKQKQEEALQQEVEFLSRIMRAGVEEKPKAEAKKTEKAEPQKQEQAQTEDKPKNKYIMMHPIMI